MANCKKDPAEGSETKHVLSERLRKLMDWNGVSYSELASGTDISIATIENILNCKSRTDYLTVCKIADYFMVSVDWLLGRVDEMDEVLSRQYFNSALILSYEAYMKHMKDCDLITRGYSAPWPYNLAEAILEKPMDGEMSKDQCDGLDYILNKTMSDCDRDILVDRYCRGKTFSEIGYKFGHTSSWAQQMVSRAIRNARHHSRSNYIRNGYNGERERLKCLDKEALYKAYSRKLDFIINEKKEELIKEKTELDERFDNLPIEEKARRTSISELDLSVRSYNCLGRADCQTVSDILGLIEKNAECSCSDEPEDILFDALLKIRNMGKHSALEVICKLKERGFLTDAA